MELVLTGGMMKARDAEAAGLVARVVPNGEVQCSGMKVKVKVKMKLMQSILEVKPSSL